MSKAAALAVALLLVSETAWAVMTPDRRFEGWTQDGALVVFSTGFDEDNRDEYEIVATRERAKSLTFSNVEKYRAWLAQHPLAKGSEDGPDEQTSAAVARDEKTGAVRCQLKHDGETRVVRTVKPRRGGRAGVSWSFSPDGKRIAWLVIDTISKPSGTGDYTVDEDVKVLFDDVSAGPRVKLVAKSVSPAAVGRARAALAQAKQAAAAVPGGATVAPLTWKAKVDLVVALGTSAETP